MTKPEKKALFRGWDYSIKNAHPASTIDTQGLTTDSAKEGEKEKREKIAKKTIFSRKNLFCA